MLTSTLNTKSTELENKIKDADIIAKNAVTKANSIKSDLNNYAKKTDVANVTSKYKYKGYGICFDEGGSFSKGNISNGKNVLIFGVDESSLVHGNNKANNIYVMGDLFVQGLMTLHYMQKKYIVKILLNQAKSLC